MIFDIRRPGRQLVGGDEIIRTAVVGVSTGKGTSRLLDSYFPDSIMQACISKRSDPAPALTFISWGNRRVLAVWLFLAGASLAGFQSLYAESLPDRPEAAAACASQPPDHPVPDDLKDQKLQDAERHYSSGLAFARSDDSARAEVEFKAAVATSPGTDRYVRSLGLFYIERDRTSEALAVIRNYADLCGPNGLGYELEAELLFKEKQFSEALIAAATSLGFEQKNARMHELVGLIYLAKGNDAGGVFELAKAETLAPQDPEVRYFYGRALYRKGLYGQARDQFLACLRIQPGYRKAAENLGLSYEALQNFPDAANAYEQAINTEEAQAGPKHGEPFAFYGAMLIKQGKSEQALSVLRKGVVLAPTSFVVNYELGKLMMNLGHLDEANKFLVAAADLAPNFSGTYYFLGTLCRRQSRLATSKKYFATFQELDRSIQNREFPLTNR